MDYCFDQGCNYTEWKIIKLLILFISPFRFRKKIFFSHLLTGTVNDSFAAQIPLAHTSSRKMQPLKDKIRFSDQNYTIILDRIRSISKEDH